MTDERRVLIPIVPRTFTGTASHVGNAGAVDWSLGGWLAYGVNSYVQILDPECGRNIQVLEKHRSPVKFVAWAQAHFLTDKTCTAHLHTLASADSAGNIVVWDVLSAEVKSYFTDPSRSVTGMKWLDGSIENTGQFLISLHPPYTINLWDTTNSSLVWKRSMEGEFLKTMDIDPFHPSRLTFLSSHYVLFLEDFNVSKAPISDGNPLYLRNFEMPKRSSSISKNSRIRRFVQDIVTMTDGNDDEWDTECIAIHFHRFLPQHLFLVFPREIFLLDLDLGQPVGSYCDRGPSLILSIYPCHTRDAFYVLQDNGIVTLRVRKNLDYSSEEVIYDTRASGELLRLQKGAKLIGMSVNVNTEHSCAIVTTDGRVFLSQLQDYSDDRTTSKGMLKALVDPSFSKAPLRNLKLNTLGVYTGLTSPPLIIRMCPALTSKNWPEYRPIMAGASAVQGSGTIQIYDLANGVVEKEFAVHTFPVRGMEWTGMNTILSYAFQNLSGESSMHSVRNELVHTDVRTGQTHQIRTHRSNESPIDLLRVSHLKQYFLLTFKNAPIELWDLNKMTHLTTMSKKFPPISALEWSPIHNLKSIKRKMASEPIAQGDEIQKKDPSAKEQFIFTDPEGQLYNLTVECNAIRNVSKLSPESGLGPITCITWKSDFIIRGDSEGNIHCMDVRKKVSKIHSTNRGLIKKIRFAPGRGNNKLFVLHIECVSLWDLSNSEFDFLGELRSQRDTVKIMDIEWAASDRPVISTADGCIKILTENLQSSTSPVDVYRLKTFSPSLLPNSSKRADFKVSIHHQPWKTKFSFHYSDSLKIQFDLLDPDLKKGLLNSNSQLERSYLASCESSVCLGESLWERDFWTVANAVLNEPLNDLTSLDINYDIMSNYFVDYSSKRLKFHLTKTIDKSKKRNTIDTLLCLVENPDDVVRSLLEIDPSDPSYYVDNLKACLVLSLKDSFSTSTQSTIKLVATNLISEGKIWEGVNLLCLIGKIFDACKYLQSYNEWEASLWLGQSRLEYEEFKQLALKYCDHCLTSHRRRRALLMYMKLKEYVMVLDVLYSGKMIPLAAKFLQVLEERECLPDSSHALVLTEEISLAYARYLFDIKNIDAAYYYCDKADEKGEILRREFDVLLSKNT